MAFQKGSRKLVSQFLSVLPDRSYGKLMTAKQVLWWKTVQRKWHLQNYRNPYNEPWLIRSFERIRRDSGCFPRRIADFGCNAGNNLYTILHNNLLGRYMQHYCGVDANREAIHFAETIYPVEIASFHCGDHRWFEANVDSLGAFDTFLASHVLYYIEESHVREILKRAAGVARYIVVADNLARFGEESGSREAGFTHPFAKICRAIGIEIIDVETNLRTNLGFRYGYFVGRVLPENRIKPT